MQDTVATIAYLSHYLSAQFKLCQVYCYVI